MSCGQVWQRFCQFLVAGAIIRGLLVFIQNAATEIVAIAAITATIPIAVYAWDVGAPRT